MKRCCLFAGFNYGNKISQYVVDYLAELSKYCDVYYLADGELDIKALSRIKPIVKGAWINNHHGYDFYSWKLLILEYIGYEYLKTYDEIIFANDSCFLVNSLKPVFNAMERKSYDFWGLLAADESNLELVTSYDKYAKLQKTSFHIGSYFYAIRSDFFRSEEFYNFIVSIKSNIPRNEVTELYEYGLYKLANSLNLKIGCFDSTVYRYSTAYMRDAFNLIKKGFPLLKVRIFTDNIGGDMYMESLGNVSAKFCSVDYTQYIEQIRSERNIKNKTKGRSFGKILRNNLRNYLPPLLIKLSTARGVREVIKSFMYNFLPPFILDLSYNLTHYRSINSSNKVRLTFRRRPKYKGWLPEQIRNYESNQLKLINSIDESLPTIIYFNIMRECVSGGMLSINRFVQASSRILKDANVDGNVLISNLPLENACINNPFFEHHCNPVDFKMLIKHKKMKNLMLNIPECFVPVFVNGLDETTYSRLFACDFLMINILNQNDELMPHQHFIEELRTLCNNNLTITAAHERYATKEKSIKYRAPVYRLKPFLPDFTRTPFRKKENVIVLSPDLNEYRNSVVDILKEKLSNYKIITVKDLSLDQYKELISNSKFTITFGEGWDGYFIEPYLCDSISFAVKNATFFPEDFPKKVKTVYESWDDLKQHIVDDIQYLDSAVNYEKTSKDVSKILKNYINNNQSYSDLKLHLKRYLNK